MGLNTTFKSFISSLFHKVAPLFINVVEEYSRSETIFGNYKPFKNDEKLFYFTVKPLFIFKIFKFLP